MKRFIIILFILLNSYDSFGCEKQASIVLSLRYDNSKVQYIKPVQRMLYEVLGKKPNAKFLIISVSDNDANSIAKNYINGIISTMVKYGVPNSQIEVKYNVVNSGIESEIQIMVE